MHIILAVIHFLAAAKVIVIWMQCLRLHWSAAVMTVLSVMFSVLSWYFPLRKYKSSGKKAYLLLTVVATLVLLATIVFRVLIVEVWQRQMIPFGPSAPNPVGYMPQWN